MTTSASYSICIWGFPNKGTEEMQTDSRKVQISVGQTHMVFRYDVQYTSGSENRRANFKECCVDYDTYSTYKVMKIKITCDIKLKINSYIKDTNYMDQTRETAHSTAVLCLWEKAKEV